MSKLVRDEIPEIIKESGKLPIYHRAAPSEVEKLLEEKLGEEIEELLTAYTAESKLEEAADVFEVLLSILAGYGFTYKDLLAKAEAKRNERGSFIKGYILDEVK